MHVTCYRPSFLLDAMYSARLNRECADNESNLQFSDLDEAKASCAADVDCVGFWSNCAGTEIYQCNSPLSIEDGLCRSILYIKNGK